MSEHVRACVCEACLRKKLATPVEQLELTTRINHCFLNEASRPFATLSNAGRAICLGCQTSAQSRLWTLSMLCVGSVCVFLGRIIINPPLCAVLRLLLPRLWWLPWKRYLSGRWLPFSTERPIHPRSLTKLLALHQWVRIGSKEMADAILFSAWCRQINDLVVARSSCAPGFRTPPITKTGTRSRTGLS